MPWSTQVHPRFPIVEVALSGRVPRRELDQLRSQVFSLGRALKRPLLLVDCTTLEGGCSEFELFEHAGDVAAHPGFCFHKEAVVLPLDPAVAREAVTWRELATKRGIRVELFQDRKSAQAWLMEK